MNDILYYHIYPILLEGIGVVSTTSPDAALWLATDAGVSVTSPEDGAAEVDDGSLLNPGRRRALRI